MDIQKEVKVIADAMLEKKGQDVLSLNLSKIGTAISDYFIVCNADSGTNVLSIADNVEDRMIEKCKRKVIRTQGRENALWVILDYGESEIFPWRSQPHIAVLAPAGILPFGRQN